MKRNIFLLALVLALSFCVIAEGASRTSSYGEITLYEDVEDTGKAPETITEAIDLAIEIGRAHV